MNTVTIYGASDDLVELEGDVDEELGSYSLPMSDKIICLSDLHGSYLTMRALLARYPDHQPIFLGDLIDRGNRSREVVEYAITHSIPTVYGNHEDLCLAYSAHAKLGYKAKCSRYYGRDVWLYNGGDTTLKSWGRHQGQPLPQDVLDWMGSLPPYMIIDSPNIEGQKLFVSHTGYGLDADKNHWMQALWGRYPDGGEFPNDGLFRVFGHTKNHEAHGGRSYVNLDTGCAYQGYGVLTGLKWPEMELVTQKNVD